MTENLKTYGPVRGKWPGVAAIDYNGARYCLDCAKTALEGQDLSVKTDRGEWGTIECANGDKIVDKLVRGDIHTLGNGGVVLKNSTDGAPRDWTCHYGEECENAIPGKEHTYDHNHPIGVHLKV